MTAIEGVGPPTVSRIGSRPSTRVGTGFAVPAQSAAAGQTSAAAEAGEVSLASMLALQEFGGDAATDREARRRGEDMLSALIELQRALLGGVGTGETMQRLADLAASVPRAADPHLAAMVSAIILRVKVELARRRV